MSHKSRTIKIECEFIAAGNVTQAREYIRCQKGYEKDADAFGEYKYEQNQAQRDIDHVCTLFALMKIESRY